MKRIVLFFLLLSTLACKAADIKYHNGFKYTATSTKVTIIGYNGPSGSIIIPSEIDGKPVKTIVELIGNSNEYIDIFVPNTVTNLGKLSDNHLPLKSVVIDTDKDIQNGGTVISFNNAHDVQFDNIIMFGTDKNISGPIDDLYKWFSSPTFVQYINKVEIQTKGQSTSLYAHIYLYDTKKQFFFDEETFQYLLNGLKMRGTPLEDITSIDLSSIKTTISFSEEFDPSSLLPIGATVKVSADLTYTNEGTIPDLVDFSAPTSDKSNITISYSRTNTQNWNSVCLPFEIEESYFPEGTKIYTYDSSTQTSITLRRTTDKVEAGRPCFIYSEADSWNLNIPNASISNGVQAQTESIGDWQLVGSFERRTIGKGKYKLTADGTEMNSTTADDATVAPFRCYVEATSASGNAPARLSVGVDEELPITVILNDEPEKKVMLYDLMGRPNSGRSAFQISTDKKQIMIRK